MSRILYISNYRKGVGGISAQIDVLCEALRSEELIVNSEETASIEDSRLKIEDCPYQADIFSTKGNPIKRIGLFFKLLFVARRYDVLHVHGCSDWGMVPVVYGVIAGKMWRKKIIVTYHGGEAAEYFKKHGAFARRWLRRADDVIVLSGFLKKVFDEYQIPCVVIPNIVTFREDIYQPKKSIAPKFISVRHLTELYRIDLIIKAFEKVVKHYPEATLDILGQGDCREKLEQSVKRKEERGKLREGSVRFVGQVPNEKIYDYLRANDIMLSAPKIDNMPVSLLEAMNAGLLVISSNVGGVPFMIEHGRTGLLFNSTKTEINTTCAAINIDKDLEVTKNAHSTSVSSNRPHGLECNQPQVLTSELAAPVIANTPNMPTDESHVECLQKNVDCINLEKKGKNNAVDALVEQMMWAVEHQEESLKMIEAAHEEVKRYSWSNIREALLPLYEV